MLTDKNATVRVGYNRIKPMVILMMGKRSNVSTSNKESRCS